MWSRVRGPRSESLMGAGYSLKEMQQQHLMWIKKSHVHLWSVGHSWYGIHVEYYVDWEFTHWGSTTTPCMLPTHVFQGKWRGSWHPHPKSWPWFYLKLDLSTEPGRCRMKCGIFCHTIECMGYCQHIQRLVAELSQANIPGHHLINVIKWLSGE